MGTAMLAAKIKFIEEADHRQKKTVSYDFQIPSKILEDMQGHCGWQ